MEAILVAGLALAFGLPAQTVVNGGRTIIGDWDASGASSTKPIQTGTTLPPSCAVGEFFFKSDASAGQNLHMCTSPDTWTVAAGGGGGEANTASNAGASGVGPFDSKSGVDLRFRNIAAGSSKVTATLDEPNKTILLDVVESNLTLNNLAGELSVAKGGTGAATASEALTNLGAAGTAASNTFAAGTSQIFNGALLASGSDRTAPAKTGTALPGTCTAGDQFFKTDASAGRNLYFCTATDTWTAMSGGDPLTTKGDLYTHNGSNSIRLAAGADGSVLVADSAQSAGLAYRSIKVGSEIVISFAGGNSSGTAYPAGGTALPGTDYPSLTTAGTAPFRVAYAAFLNSANQTVNLAIRLPLDWDGGAVTGVIPAEGGSATYPSQVKFNVRTSCIAEGGDFINPASWNGPDTITINLTAASQMATGTQTLSMGSCAAGQLLYAQITRDVTDSHDGTALSPHFALRLKRTVALE